MNGFKELKCLMILLKTAKCLYFIRKLMIIVFFAAMTFLGLSAVSSGKLSLKKFL